MGERFNRNLKIRLASVVPPLPIFSCKVFKTDNLDVYFGWMSRIENARRSAGHFLVLSLVIVIRLSRISVEIGL
jgi:hypothetical protein